MKALTILFLVLTLGVFAQNKPEIVIQSGHSNSISSSCFSPDGKYIITGSKDNTALLWDVSTGKEIHVFRHSNEVNAVTFSSDGKYIVTGSRDNTAKVWDFSAFKALMEYKYTYFSSVDLSPDGKYLLGGFVSGYPYLWNLDTKEKYGVIEWLSNTKCKFSPDGKSIYLVGNPMEGFQVYLYLVKAESKEQIYKVRAHENQVNSLSISLDGKYLLTGSSDNKAILWEASTGKEIYTFNGHKSSVLATAISPDSKYAATGSKDNTLKLWDISSGKETKEFKFDNTVTSIAYSPNGNTIFIGLGNGNAMLYDAFTGLLIRKFSEEIPSVYSATFSPDGKYILAGVKQNTKLWELSSGRVIRKFNNTLEKFSSVTFSHSGKYIFLEPSVYETSSGKEITKIYGTDFWLNSFSFSPDEKFLLSSNNDEVVIQEISTGKKNQPLKVKKDQLISNIAFSLDGKMVAASCLGLINVWEVPKGNRIRKMEIENNNIFTTVFSPDGKYLLTGAEYVNMQLWDIANKEFIRTFPSSLRVTSASFSPDGKYLITASKKPFIRFESDTIPDDAAILWDVNSVKELYKFKGHTDGVTSVSYNPQYNYVLTGSSDGTCRIWNTETKDWTAFLANAEGTQWLIYNNEGYWDASQNGGDLVAMVQGLNCWNIDQFAVKNNRPDKILAKLPNTDPELIKHYYTQYQKRLKKLNLTEDKLSKDFETPETKITKTIQNGKNVTIDFTISTQSSKVVRYNIFVNDVPVFGVYGKTIPNESNANSKHLSLSETLELTVGDNKVEVSAMNENGSESYRALTYAIYNGEVKKDLYLLAFGVSKYQNQSYNLAYADKDAIDLSKVIETYKGKSFENIYTKVLTNEQVTPDAIKASKDFVKNAKPDDTFILFIAGHGMHDKDAEATYYYLTSNADINNLKGTAADFETIEDLLQGIPPRNKLFLMDACESGEIDEEDQGKMNTAATGVGINSRGFKSAKTQTQNTERRTPKRSYLYQKDRYIYNDLVRRSGAIVFSSSKGGELSYERSDIENGLFTENIMKALTTSEADKDYNGTVSTDELREYVIEQVAKASGDLQHPTVDRDNIYQKFGFSLK